jgi:hypothetical protein
MHGNAPACRSTESLEVIREAQRRELALRLGSRRGNRALLCFGWPRNRADAVYVFAKFLGDPLVVAPGRRHSLVSSLNIAGSIIAALPVALGLVWMLRQFRVSTALAISVLTALIVVLPIFGTDMSPFAQHTSSNSLHWINVIGLFLAVLSAVPLLVSLVLAVTSNNRFERTTRGRLR